jgi:hypothetical protein
MQTANCTFCKRRINFGVFGGHLKVTHLPPHCQRFRELSPATFLKQSVDKICSDANKQLRQKIN